MPQKRWSPAKLKEYTLNPAKGYEAITYFIHEYKTVPFITKSDLIYYIKELFECHVIYMTDDVIKLGDELYVDKITPKTDYYKMWGKLNHKKVRWEHVVPSSILVDLVLELYDKGEFTLDAYIKIKNMGVVCIVTIDEDLKLTNAGYRAAMPNDWDKQNVFARYDALNIHYHKYIFG